MSGSNAPDGPSGLPPSPAPSLSGKGPVRTGWLFCGGMIRSGSTLQYQMISLLVEALGVGRRGGWREPDALDAAIAAGPGDGLVTLKTHKATPGVVAACREGWGRPFYIYRDLRDVVASYRRKYDDPLEGEAVERFVRWLVAEDAAWRALPGVHVARYEDVVADRAAEIRAAADRLGLAPDPGLVERLSDDLAPDRQRRRLRATPEDAWIAAGGRIRYEPRSLLHEDHFQSGEVGRWRRELAAGQAAGIERAAGDWLAANGYL